MKQLIRSLLVEGKQDGKFLELSFQTALTMDQAKKYTDGRKILKYLPLGGYAMLPYQENEKVP